jgi:DNA replication protein DnaC
MVESLRSGFNSTILAYGDSGSGKTHTMIGPAGSIGDAEVRF